MSDKAPVFAFTLPIEVCLRDLDGLGHVNNAVYLTYIETARNKWVFALAGKSKVGEFDFILARTEINFRSAASLHETLNVSLRPTRIGRSSWDLAYEIREVSSQRLIVDAVSTQVSFNYATDRSQPVGEEQRRTLEREIERCALDTTSTDEGTH